MGAKVADETIRGKVVVITGGGRGLGRAMALGLAGAGAKVVITGAREGGELTQTEADCRAVGDEDGVLALKADITVDGDCRRVFDETLSRFGAVHALINNAGRGMGHVSKTFTNSKTGFWQVEPGTWRMLMDTNVNGAFNMARLAAPLMVEQGWGRIVNVSTSLITMQRKGFSPYGPSKWAIEGESVIWAQDLDGTGVTVNVLLPGGATDTAMIPGTVGDKSRTGADGNLFEAEIMAPPALYLVSDESDGHTGDRYVAKLWDASLPPAEAAAKARFPVRREREF